MSGLDPWRFLAAILMLVGVSGGLYVVAGGLYVVGLSENQLLG